MVVVHWEAPVRQNPRSGRKADRRRWGRHLSHARLEVKMHLRNVLLASWRRGRFHQFWRLVRTVNQRFRVFENFALVDRPRELLYGFGQFLFDF